MSKGQSAKTSAKASGKVIAPDKIAKGCHPIDKEAKLPVMRQTRSKQSMETVAIKNAKDIPQESAPSKRLKLSKNTKRKSDKISDKEIIADKVAEEVDNSTDSINNNAMVSAPVVGTTKSLIDSIKAIRQGKGSNALAMVSRKVVRQTNKPPEKRVLQECVLPTTSGAQCSPVNRQP